MPSTRNQGDKTKDGNDMADNVKILVYQVCATSEFQRKISEIFSCIINDVIQGHLKAFDDKTSQLEVRLGRLEDRVLMQEAEIDALKQSRKRRSLCISGLQEDAEKKSSDLVLNMVSTRLSITISSEDLTACYRIGKSSTPGKPRPLIVDFSDAGVRDRIYRAKSILKGSKIFISENLTSSRLSLIRSAAE